MRKSSWEALVKFKMIIESVSLSGICIRITNGGAPGCLNQLDS